MKPLLAIAIVLALSGCANGDQAAVDNCVEQMVAKYVSLDLTVTIDEVASFRVEAGSICRQALKNERDEFLDLFG